jgi:hypothetical protein
LELFTYTSENLRTSKGHVLALVKNNTQKKSITKIICKDRKHKEPHPYNPWGGGEGYLVHSGEEVPQALLYINLRCILTALYSLILLYQGLFKRKRNNFFATRYLCLSHPTFFFFFFFFKWSTSPHRKQRATYK